MALRKSRFIHLQSFNRMTPYRGFTVLLRPAWGRPEDPIVVVQVAICAKDDHFCKRTGRMVAEESEPVTLPVTQLPVFLAELKAKVFGYKIEDDLLTRRYFANEYAWVWKYFL